jgi:hypothetical protein
VPLLDIQRRMAEIGRVRIGMKNERGLPTKLDRFRVTSQSKDVVDAVAALYGGEVKEWRPGKGPAQWEVVTTTNALDVVVAPGQVLSQWWEKWRAGACDRRCDGVTEQLSDSPCMCPSDLEDRKKAAAQKVPAACRPVTRFSFLIRDVPVLGLFRLESRGEMVAMEMSGVATFLEAATQMGLFIPARLVLHERGIGTAHQYVVPVLEIAGSYGQIAEALGTINSLQSGQPPTLSLAPPVAESRPSRPALPAGEGVPATVTAPPDSRAPLPSSPRGRAAKVALPDDRPPLPADPSFSINVVDDPADRPLKLVPPPLPADPFDALPGEAKAEPMNSRGQQLATSARRAGIDEETRHALILWHTKGRTSSGSEVSDDEAGQLHLLFSELKRNKRTITFDADGNVVGVE